MDKDKASSLGQAFGVFVATCIVAFVYGNILHVVFPALTLLQSCVIGYAFVVFVNSLGSK